MRSRPNYNTVSPSHNNVSPNYNTVSPNYNTVRPLKGPQSIRVLRPPSYFNAETPVAK